MPWRREDLRIYQRFFVAKIKQCFHPDPRRRLREYPHDAATGYAANELRGAFSLRR